MRAKLPILIVSFFLMFLSVLGQDKNKTSEEITIYWDTSLSMLDKDITKEVELLHNYFLHKKNATVVLIPFSNTTISSKKYKVVDSDWKSLRKDLLSTNYDGATLYTGIKFNPTSTTNLFFTDGVETLDGLVIDRKVPTYFICSTEDKNFQLLIKEGFGSKGGYIDLTSDSTKEALESLKIKNVQVIVKEKKIVGEVGSFKAKRGKLKGKVFNDQKMLSNAIVYVNDKETSTRSNEKGEFTIEVTQGDVLKVKHLGKYSLNVEVNDFKSKDFYLPEKENVLEVVNIKGNKKEEKKLIETAYGKIDKDRVGYATKTLTEEELNKANATDITSAVMGKIAGLDVESGPNADIAKIRLNRSRYSSDGYPLLVVDGLPIKRANFTLRYFKASNFLDPKNIASITVLKGLAATNKYGSEGGHGVYLITTKTALAGKAKTKNVNSALAKNNDYKEENLTLANDNGSSYLEGFKGSKSSLEAYKLYLQQRKKHSNDIEYYVSVSDYLSQWGAKDLALRVFTNAIEISMDNIRNLKYIAYKSEENKLLDISEQVLKRLIKIQPKEAQSYRDLALIYVKKKEYQKAADIYVKMFMGVYDGVDFKGLAKTIDSEVSKLVLLHGQELDISDLPPKYQTMKSSDIDARLVFDWNYSDAEFELQFVNPQKKFFKWSHTSTENPERISEEKSQGFYSEEFLLVGVKKGEWLINVESKSSNSIKPIVLKYSVYKNYGKSNETEEVRTVLLSNLKGKKLLGKVKI